MSFLPSLPEQTNLSDVFKLFPKNVRPILEYHDLLLRGESPLSIAERELIAAYVSGLNACEFCSGAHQILAEVMGIDGHLFDQLLNDVETADIDEKLKPVFLYVKKLTLSPSKMTSSDARKILDAGWPEQTVHDAVSVCALFNFMNRFIEGMGVETSKEIQDDQRRRHHPEEAVDKNMYMNYGRKIGIIND